MAAPRPDCTRKSIRSIVAGRGTRSTTRHSIRLHWPVEHWCNYAFAAVRKRAAALTGQSGRAFGGGSSTPLLHIGVPLMPVSEKPRSSARRVQRMARAPQPPMQDQAESCPSPAPRITKVQTVLDLLQRPEGSSLNDLVAATGWQPHTARAMLTGLKKKGHQLTSRKLEAGPRIYRIVTAETAQ